MEKLHWVTRFSVFVGDTLTGSRRVLEKHKRRGSRFVTYRVEASNQRGELVCLSDATMMLPA